MEIMYKNYVRVRGKGKGNIVPVHAGNVYGGSSGIAPVR
jgi:hypothetical protein